MEEQNKNQASNSPTKKTYWNLIVVIGLIVFLIGGFLLWSFYLSPDAKRERELQKNYKQAQKTLNELEEAMRNDTYGGKIPEETLSMFIEALEKGDIELASRYFVLGADGNLQKDLIEGLKKAKEENRIAFIIDIAKKSKLDPVHSDEETAWFTVNNEKGISEYSIILKLNRQSGVWKIESL